MGFTLIHINIVSCKINCILFTFIFAKAVLLLRGNMCILF